ncbi:other TTK protein kinase [Lentinula edodes]|uniref:Other TTK protein kinase n=1 Tax=Lentinula edodes TaxID=5353 RepID=A0A1Q3EEX0_LENED|nr:other TTK protein kinase [Lentinula edodes]
MTPLSRAPSVSPSSSESSVIDELSFDYDYDEAGNIVRNSKGSRTSPQSFLSTPPTDTSGVSRAASGPIPSTTTADSAGPPIRTLPRTRIDNQYEARQKRHTEEVRARLASIELEEKENAVPIVDDLYGSRPAASTSSSSRLVPPTRATYGSQSLGGLSRPLIDAPQRVMSSSSRMLLKGTGTKPQIDRISEAGTEGESDGGEDAYAGYGGHGHELFENNAYGTDTDADDDEAIPRVKASRSQQSVIPPHSAGIPPSSLNEFMGTRPRRSASLSDTLLNDGPHHVPSQAAQPSQRPSSRPGTSLGLRRELPGLPPRRVADERFESNRDNERDEYQLKSRNTPSPPHYASGQQLVVRAPYANHKRRDSDTLRGYSPGGNSPTVMEAPPRVSPSVKGLSGGVSSRTSSNDKNAVNIAAKHRRSPTAPEPATGSGLLQAGVVHNVQGRTWAAGDRDSGDGYDAYSGNEEKEREREARRERGRSQQLALSQVPQAKGPAPPPPNAAQHGYPPALGRHILVNKKVYARLDMIGKGGSSRVFRVMTYASELYAIKKVALDKTDSETMAGYMNEIALLKRLEGNSRIIRLVDSEVKAGPGGSKGHLLLVMECGEIDLARLISERSQEGLDMVWIAYYWQQMLQAVQVIHDEKIVHSDLKPGNFVLVKGQLKLIDFGIANAIANDTTNIQRDHQIGTLNYMSPEAIELPDGMRRLKVGRSSDVWSLGCILYQMIYGSTPFSQLTIYQKMKAIPNANFEIPYPEYSVPVIPTSKSSQGEPKRLEHLRRMDRMTIPELLQEDWLAMKEPPTPEPTPTIKDLLKPDEAVINPFYMGQLLRYGIQLGLAGQSLEDPQDMAKAAERLISELRAVQDK